MVRIAEVFRFGSKAETLERLQGRVTKSSVPEFYRFTVTEWRQDATGVEHRIGELMGDARDLIVRSSAMNEDGELYAQAGAFLSVPHIQPNDQSALREAIEDVIASYCKGGAGDVENPSDQVIVQRMVPEVSMSGVLFTQDLSSGAPYYVINYDDESGSTETVTGGTGYANRTIYIYREAWEELDSERFSRLLEAIREIEELTGDGCLDIEFALDANMNVYILQVRRITTQPNWNRGLGLRIGDAINRLYAGVGPRLFFGPNNTDNVTVLGKMPDWNPAEMIGNAPRRLAFSLYRYMITDFAWRHARAIMGYQEPRGLPLMWSCAGQPYIDVRQSFRSYLPERLDGGLSERIVTHWVKKLSEEPQLHDKVEFSVAITTWSFDFKRRAKALLPGDLSHEEREEVEDAFRDLTIELVEGRRASLTTQNEAVRQLQSRHRRIVGEDRLRPDIRYVAQLLEDAIEFGTVPFSVLARHGFIAKTLLDSLVEEGVLSSGEVEAFSQSVPTVASEFLVDIERFGRGSLSVDELFERYGHLRPGTYDILSWRYDQRGENFLGGAGDFDRHSEESPRSFNLNGKQKDAIDRRLQKAGFSIQAEDLLDYCAGAIQGREWAKFVFTRSVSDSLELLAAWGQRLGLSREELSHLDIRDLLDSLVETKGRSLEDYLRTLAEQGRKDHEVTSAIRLPYILTRPSDLVVVPMLLDQPNFVTLGSVRGECLQLTGSDIEPSELDGKIIVIESADPGFDWIFTRKIEGLVTKFGGANSHMAIRCAEFDLPAAIGCGEQIFERVVRSGYIELDCAVGRIEPVQH